MQNSLLITDDRVYEGETNLEGQPDGKGFLIDFNLKICAEGFFKSEEN